MLQSWKSQMRSRRRSMVVAVVILFLALGDMAFAAGKSVPTARVSNSTSQSIAHNSWTVLIFDSEDYDAEALHDTSSNTSRLTAPIAGVYAISATALWASGVTKSCVIGLAVNAPGTGPTTFIAGSSMSSAVETQSMCGYLNVATQYVLAAGDYVEAYVLQANTFAGDKVVDAHLEMTFVAPAPR